MISLEGVVVWTLLAFERWLAMTFAFDMPRLKGAAVAAALLSWLTARVMLSVVPAFLEWLRSHAHA
jgi:hypothetical protein